MLGTPNVHVHRRPILFFFFINKHICIVRINKPQIVPRRPCPLWHRVRLTLAYVTTIWTRNIHPVRNTREWRLSCSCWLVGFHLWQNHRQIFFRDRNNTTLLPVNKWNRLTPITLAREHPILKAILGDPSSFYEVSDFLFCVFVWRAVKLTRIY